MEAYSMDRPEDRDVVQQKRHHAPEDWVDKTAELHRYPGSDTDQGVHDRDREQIPADVLLDLAGNLHSCAFVLNARQHLDETARQTIAGG